MASNPQQGPVTGLTPHIAIRDGRASEAIDFYKAAFGAEEATRMPADDGKRLMHAHLLINGGSLMMHDEFPEYSGGEPSPEPGSTTLHLQVDDADTWFARAKAAGATVTMPIADMFWGDRYVQVKDPFGHVWAIGSPVKS